MDRVINPNGFILILLLLKTEKSSLIKKDNNIMIKGRYFLQVDSLDLIPDAATY